MITGITATKLNIKFCSKKDNGEKEELKSHILPNSIKTNLQQGFQKTTSAFLDYPIKGLQGDINSNFYEFLTMGIVPYLVGSGMFMFVFNCANKFFDAKAQKEASKIGKKLGLGVILYGVMKTLSKNLVTKPIKAMTGVDTEMPYEHITYTLPKEAGENAKVEVLHQQRKVFDSKEFYRKDLLISEKGYFEKVAKKLGLGENLNDPVSEASPIIQNIVTTSNTAKSLSSYAWAGVGVALANQDAWLDLFDAISNRKKYVSKEGETLASKIAGKTLNLVKNIGHISKTFAKSLLKSISSLWKGNPAYTGFMKHAGKSFILVATALTVGLTSNTIIRAKNMAKYSDKSTIDKNKESVEF